MIAYYIPPLPYLTFEFQFSMMSDQFFAYDSTIVAPLSRVPVWPYTLHHLMPHKCHGNKENCPSRSADVGILNVTVNFPHIYEINDFFEK